MAMTASKARGPGSSSTLMMDPAMTPGSVPSDQQTGEATPGLSLPPVAVQRSGGRDDVVEQVRGCDRRARRSQDRHLERKQQHRSRHPGRGRHRRHSQSCGEGDDVEVSPVQHLDKLVS